MLDFGPETQNVPAQCARDLDRAIWESVKLFEPHALAVPETSRHASAFRAQINAKIALLFHLSLCKPHVFSRTSPQRTSILKDWK